MRRYDVSEGTVSILTSYSHRARVASKTTEERMEQRQRQKSYKAKYRETHQYQLAMKNYKLRVKCVHILFFLF